MENPKDFILVKEPLTLIDLLKERLPFSANVYNLALMTQDFGQDIQFLVLNMAKDSSKPLQEPSTWIMTKYIRIDYGVFFNISGPKSKAKGSLEMVKLKEVFINTKWIDWNGAEYSFNSIDAYIYDWILDISARIKRNATSVYPNYLYSMPMEDVQKLKNDWDPNRLDGLSLKPLDLNLGLEFLLRTWKYTKDGSREYFEKVLAHSESSGIYNSDGKPVCGIALGTNGLIALLYTDSEVRGQGLAKTVFKDLALKMSARGMIPCSNVETYNASSIKFHENMGFKKDGLVFYMNYLKP